ncbi:MAG: tRNA (N(6)-L-threonylcarbamoyladenosine(37)-C(2))-methylthiotransferase [Candidatus Nanoarchaeia archaeon]|nr:tRNA (N(6)-L-threonylcarbamoyladenosine(37)-C(2))-methylthiotransferase [Candidatus Nanoarchaeia archaeon]
MPRIKIETFGCAHNQADSETMSQYLINSGFDLVDIDYDLIIFNTCTVKNPTEDKFFSRLAKEKKPVVICGCIPQSYPCDVRLKNYSLLGLDNLDLIVDVVQKTLKGEVVHILDRKDFERNFLPSFRENKLIAKIPILQGCLGNCTYCKTKFARGDLKSFSLMSILFQIKKASSEGVREVWLVSQDNGCYGLDAGLTLIDLLREIVKLNLDCKVRIGMLNPNFAYKYSFELGEILTHDCFYKFLHIPVQSGSNSVLEKMNRTYSIEEFEEALNVIKGKNADITFSTDIICGFPNETEEDFEKTIKLISKWDFVLVNVSKFYPRNGTVAASMKLLPTDVVKKRSSSLMKLIKDQKPLDKYFGCKVKVNFVEKNSGYTENYISVLVETDENLSGKVLEVEIVACERFSLNGKINFSF